jgi:hypothetical protein
MGDADRVGRVATSSGQAAGTTQMGQQRIARADQFLKERLESCATPRVAGVDATARSRTRRLSFEGRSGCVKDV